MVIIEGFFKKAPFTIFSSNEEFAFNKKDDTLIFKDKSISIAQLFKEYKKIDKIVLKIYEDGTLVTSSSYFRKKDEEEDKKDKD